MVWKKLEIENWGKGFIINISD